MLEKTKALLIWMGENPKASAVLMGIIFTIGGFITLYLTMSSFYAFTFLIGVICCIVVIFMLMTTDKPVIKAPIPLTEHQYMVKKRTEELLIERDAFDIIKKLEAENE